MKTMLVYRVENADRKGPYNGAGDMDEQQLDRHTDMCIAHSNAKTHPTPQVDRVWRLNPKSQQFDDRYLFGFASRADMVAWFGGWGEHLEDLGYQVSVYRALVPRVIAGRCQVAVKRHAMVRVRQYPVAKLIP